MAEYDKDQPTESNSAEPSANVGAEDESLPSIETCHEAKDMAMLCHIFGVVGFFGPLVIWLSEREKHRFVAQHGRAAINYQISLMIYFAVCWLLRIALIGVVLIWLLTIVHIVLIVMAALAAKRGEAWRYPIAIDFLK